jgi:hypothetical protein
MDFVYNKRLVAKYMDIMSEQFLPKVERSSGWFHDDFDILAKKFQNMALDETEKMRTSSLSSPSSSSPSISAASSSAWISSSALSSSALASRWATTPFDDCCVFSCEIL